MKNRWAFLFVLPALLACSGEKKVVLQTSGVEAPSVSARVERASRIVEISGTVRASDVAELASRMGGFVTNIRVHAGAKVKKGELLVVLDDRSVQAQSEKAQGAEEEAGHGIEEAKQHLRSAESQKILASNTFDRIESLYKRNSASKQEFEEAGSRRDAAIADWEAATQRLAQADSRLHQVASQQQEISAALSYQRITAPFDGIVTSVSADEGTFVASGQVLVVIENPARYQLVFSIEQDLLSVVKRGDKIPVEVPAAHATLQSTVEEVSASADSATRTYTVKADLPSNAALRTGIFGRAQVLASSDSSLWIPAAYVNRKNDLELVLVRAGNEWRRVLIKTGEQKQDRVEILAGLQEGDEVGPAGEKP